MKMSPEEFEQTVAEALDLIPDRFIEALDNIVVVVEDEPDEYHLGTLDDPYSLGGSFHDDELLGLYDGVNLVERADGYELDAPDVITIFQGPHERCFSSRREMVAEIRKTVIHEIGHYFGIDDERLHEMGY